MTKAFEKIAAGLANAIAYAEAEAKLAKGHPGNGRDQLPCEQRRTRTIRQSK